MTKNSKRIIIILASITIVAIVIVAITTYGLWQRIYTQKGVNEDNFGCLDITYSENVQGLTEENAYPMSIAEGVETEPYEVTMTNTCDVISPYDVVLSKKSGSSLDDQYIRLQVDGTIKRLNEVTETTSVSFTDFSASESKIISKGVLGPKAKRKIKIQVWFDNINSANQSVGSDVLKNKTFDYKISILNTTAKSNLLAQAIIEQGVKNGTPDFTKGEPPSSGAASATGSGLFKVDDDEGTSYYFRGQVENNYVKFGKNTNEEDLIWRIVRINGDGTIRLILDGQLPDEHEFNYLYNESKSVGYTYDNSACTLNSPCWSYHSNNTFTNTHGGNNSNIKTELEKWYNSTLNGFDNKIAYGTYCNDTSFGGGDETGTLYYGAYTRLIPGSNDRQPILTCPNPKDQYSNMRTYGGVYKLKIGLLSADEINYAGYTVDYSASWDNYLYNENYPYWWVLSPSSNEYRDVSGFYGMDGYILRAGVGDNLFGVRPVINLTSDVLITSGDGSSDLPYEVE